MSALNGRILVGRSGHQYCIEEPLDLDELGSPKGAMARVFRVLDLQTSGQLAAKIINPRLLDDEPEIRNRFLAQFYKEARIMEELHHPSIVTLHDYNTDGDLPFLVMDYIQGETLDDCLRREGRLDFAASVDILAPVMQALAYAHSRGVVHRDIKPSNILLSTEGRAYLTDFGIARAAQESGLSSRTALTLGSYQFGTPMYMAPEQALRLPETIGPRTDQYSLGVVAWRMLAGRYYLARTDAKDSSDYTSMVVGSKPLTLSRFAPSVPPRAELAIARSLSKSPTDRFDDIAEFCEEMTKALVNPDWTHLPDPLSGWDEPAWLVTGNQSQARIAARKELESAQALPAPAPQAQETEEEDISWYPSKKTEPSLQTQAHSPQLDMAWLDSFEQQERSSTQPLDLTLPDWFESKATTPMKASGALPARPQSAPPSSVAAQDTNLLNSLRARAEQAPVALPKEKEGAASADPWVLKPIDYPGAEAAPGRYRLNWNSAKTQEKWAYDAIGRRLRGRPPLFLMVLWPILCAALISVFVIATDFPWYVRIPLAIAIATLLTLPFLLGWWSSASSLKGHQPVIVTGWLTEVGGPTKKSGNKLILKEGRSSAGHPDPCTLSIAPSRERAANPDTLYICRLWDRDRIELPASALNQRVAVATIHNKRGPGVSVVGIKVL